MGEDKAVKIAIPSGIVFVFVKWVNTEKLKGKSIWDIDEEKNDSIKLPLLDLMVMLGTLIEDVSRCDGFCSSMWDTILYLVQYLVHNGKATDARLLRHLKEFWCLVNSNSRVGDSGSGVGQVDDYLQQAPVSEPWAPPTALELRFSCYLPRWGVLFTLPSPGVLLRYRSERKLVMLSAIGLSPSRVQYSTASPSSTTLELLKAKQW
ncbi:hypothetical protein Tco_0472168 [Tanacetum coccineum]